MKKQTSDKLRQTSIKAAFAAPVLGLRSFAARQTSQQTPLEKKLRGDVCCARPYSIGRTTNISLLFGPPTEEIPLPKSAFLSRQNRRLNARARKPLP
jgi:hypothetical protein